MRPQVEAFHHAGGQRVVQFVGAVTGAEPRGSGCEPDRAPSFGAPRRYARGSRVGHYASIDLTIDLSNRMSWAVRVGFDN
jgi:hypothetical protein